VLSQLPDDEIELWSGSRVVKFSHFRFARDLNSSGVFIHSDAVKLRFLSWGTFENASEVADGVLILMNTENYEALLQGPVNSTLMAGQWPVNSTLMMSKCQIYKLFFFIFIHMITNDWVLVRYLSCPNMQNKIPRSHISKTLGESR
jgi:hypothetical protein